MNDWIIALFGTATVPAALTIGHTLGQLLSLMGF